ncbi:hypothetical protein CRM22_000349 [Opisthorchis felineus]|uniref:Uncharacterized protein n=1 Tax=Opisthorchis felineus TaxID=147828 RepID=A0A4S2MLP7_OPIFE|nr:hypothetical protein CRM22_000349 [Opisthorchis felineus]
MAADLSTRDNDFSFNQHMLDSLGSPVYSQSHSHRQPSCHRQYTEEITTQSNLPQANEEHIRKIAPKPTTKFKATSTTNIAATASFTINERNVINGNNSVNTTSATVNSNIISIPVNNATTADTTATITTTYLKQCQKGTLLAQYIDCENEAQAIQSTDLNAILGSVNHTVHRTFPIISE